MDAFFLSGAWCVYVGLLRNIDEGPIGCTRLGFVLGLEP